MQGHDDYFCSECDQFVTRRECDVDGGHYHFVVTAAKLQLFADTKRLFA
jgi:hypothetical protein